MKINQYQLASLIKRSAFHLAHDALKATAPLWIHSQPGSGKVYAIKEAAKANGLVVHDLRVSVLNPLDVYPTKVDGKTVWPPMSYLPQEGCAPTLFLIDDIDTVAPRVRDAMIELATTRELGDYTLPDNVQVVLATASVIGTSLADRFMIYEYGYDAEEVGV